MNCSASVAEEEKYPDPPDTQASIDGTHAHLLGELLLNGESKEFAELIVGQDVFDHAWGPVQEWLLAVRKIRFKYPKAVMLVEHEVDASETIGKDEFGTCDTAIIVVGEVLYVIDYKHGKGKAVSAVKNTQMLYYALGIANKYSYNFKRVVMMIVQPRIETDLKQEWEITIDELKSWLPVFGQAVRNVYFKPKYKVGEWCHFCKARAGCSELQKQAMKDVADEFEVIADDEPTKALVAKGARSPKALAPDVLAEYLDRVPALLYWASGVKQYAFEHLRKGGTIPGYKMVEKRGRRQWVNADRVMREAVKLKGEKAINVTKKLKNLKDLESLLGKDWVKERVAYVTGGLTVVADDDPRNAIDPVGADFDFIDDEETNEEN